MAKTKVQKDPDNLQTALLAWYWQHRRDLPWRQNHDAYRVWVSEIMLQQTRVAAVLEHYRIFMEAFPSVKALAEAEEARVLALWSGLGYYRRARMLHRAAKVITEELEGGIPHTAEELRKLPGVGRYTAAAIASIAYGEAVAVVDGNVERVLTRLDGELRAEAVAWKRAEELLDRRYPGDWNQAMMELGAMVCTPQSPQCLVCPVRTWCRAPGAEIRKPQAARKRVKVTRALIERGEWVYLVQRSSDAVKMAGMWELPEMPKMAAKLDTEILFVVRHSITDTDYEVEVASAGLKVLGTGKKAGRWIAYNEIGQLPLTGLTRKILRKQGLR